MSKWWVTATHLELDGRLEQVGVFPRWSIPFVLAVLRVGHSVQQK